MNEPQALGADEDVSTDEVICGGTSNVLRQTRHTSGELQLAVVSEHGDDYRELGRRQAERREPVQYEPAHGSGTDRLYLACGDRRRDDPPLHRPLVAAPGGSSLVDAPGRPASSTAMTSVSERNKRKVQLFIEAVWNRGRLELIDELVAADYLGRFSWLDVEVVGPNGVRRLVSRSRRKHADIYVKIEDQVAEDDLVVTRWRATARAPDARRWRKRRKNAKASNPQAKEPWHTRMLEKGSAAITFVVGAAMTFPASPTSTHSTTSRTSTHQP